MLKIFQSWIFYSSVKFSLHGCFNFSDVKRACELLEKLQKSKYCGEVPATKLAALQKVLQSEFLNAVREVYEHVYETVDVQGNPEIRASATAKVVHIYKSDFTW